MAAKGDRLEMYTIPDQEEVVDALQAKHFLPMILQRQFL